MNNILSRTDSINNQYEDFTYDEYDRLSSWENDGEREEYTYDIYGNLQNNYFNTQMEYNDKNQIVSKSTKDNISYEYTYDKNGNILSDGVKSYTYTSFNKVKTIQNKDEIVYFKYDSFNNLVSKEDLENSNTIIVHF